MASDSEQYDGSSHVGARLGLPASGRGSMSSWYSRIAALLLDWAACMLIATAFLGREVLTGHDWRIWAPLALFWLQSTVLVAFAGGSFGQLVCRITVARLHGTKVGLLRAAARQLMVCLVIPALVIDGDRRGLHDMAAGTALLNRR